MPLDHSLEAILEAARRAVSADNGQPWKFYWRNSQLLVLLDAKRARSFFDSNQYATYLGIGSLLENLDIAARHLGYKAQMDLLPDFRKEGEEVVASISFLPHTPQVSPLYPAIFERHTNRRLYDSPPIGSEARTAISQIGEDSIESRVIIIDDRDLKTRLAAMTAAAEAVRFNFSSREAHADFFQCLRMNQEQAQATKDGLWVRCLEVSTPQFYALNFLAVRPFFAALLARLGIDKLFAQQTKKILKHTRLVACVITSSRAATGDKREFIAAGRLCQRLWLTAAQHGVACQPMGVLPIFFAQYDYAGAAGFPGTAGGKVAVLQEKVYELLQLKPHERLRMVFRLGYAQAASARSYRRLLSDLITFSDDSPILRSITSRKIDE